MSDPERDKIRLRPRRAAPLQPDRPWGEKGSDPAGAAEPAIDTTKGTPQDPESVQRQKEQAEVALSNTRQGYG